MNFSLSNYNARQREVITADAGPMLVISGAGTGKTHVIAGKILHLILERQIPPSEILALTFTEKATNEMVERVDAGLPLGHEEVCIKTFHGLCDSILREHGHEIGLSLDFKILGDVDMWMFLKRHVLDFKLKYYRSLGNPQKFLGALQEYFSRLQDEDITSQAYIEHAEKALKKAENPEEVEAAQKHAELAHAYATYQRLLAEKGFLDFGGLLFHTIRLFENRPSALADFQKRFKYILVDEFQDTNFAQNKIVMMLAKVHANLCVVGDDDQSIYKWRGASLTNIQAFEKTFPRAKKIVLNENYRSSQIILDTGYSLIQRNNPNRLEVTAKIDKQLLASGKHKTHIPEVHHFSTLDEEVESVIAKATKALSRGSNTAILVRTNSLALPFLNALKRGKLPFQHFSPAALFTKAGVKDCIALLRCIADPTDDLALFRLLGISFWNIPMENLLALMKKVRLGRQNLFGLLGGSAYSEIKKQLSSLIEFSRDHSVSEVLGAFFNETNYLKEATANQSEVLDDIAAFSERIRDFESRNEYKSVSDFLAYASLLEEVGSYEREGPALDPSSIKVLTIHGAKGLEFDTVFLPGLVAGRFPSINRRDPFEIPEELIPEKLPLGDRHIEEERRLFYVALTRAREELVLSYSDFYDGKKQWKVSPFVLEALESGKMKAVTSKKVKTAGRNQSELPLEDGPASREHKTLKLNLPKLSYSQLDTFQTCPLKYQFRYLFNIPTPMPGVVNFGSSIHNTLKDFYTALQKKPTEKPENHWQLLKQFYEKNWIPSGYESRALSDDQKKNGEEMLASYLKHEQKNFVVPAFIEKSFTLELGEITLTGRIDRIDQLPDGTYEVVDYKTGTNKFIKINSSSLRAPAYRTGRHGASAKISTREEAERPRDCRPSEDLRLKKDLQLSIYALACRDVLKIPVSKLSLYFIENLEKVSTSRTDRDLESCKQELIELAKEMAASTFEPTPGFHCSYCDFRLICPAAMPMTR